MRRNIYLILVLIVFGIILLPFGIVLWALTTPFDKKGVVIFQYARVWAFCLIHMNPFWRVELEGAENVDPDQSYVMVSNHQAMYDIPLLYYVPLHFKWVAKREVLKMPIIGWVLWMQHGIALRRGDPNSAKKMMKKGVEFLNQGNSVMIFPEGTRSKTGRVNAFMPGAFLMATKSKHPILPVVIDGALGVTQKKGSGHIFKVKILPAISVEEIASTKIAVMSEKINNIIREEHIKMAPHHYIEKDGE